MTSAAPDTSADVAAFLADLDLQPRRELFLVLARPGPAERPGDIETLLRHLGFASRAAESFGWTELSPERARRLLLHVLKADLAYSGSLRHTDHATRLAAGFLALFEPSAELLTNSGLPGILDEWGNTPRGGYGYGSGGFVTGATFEAGVVARDERRIGILWASDED